MTGADAAAHPSRPSRGSRFFQGLQKMGRSLRLAIAVLPAAVRPQDPGREPEEEVEDVTR